MKDRQTDSESDQKIGLRNQTEGFCYKLRPALESDQKRSWLRLCPHYQHCRQEAGLSVESSQEQIDKPRESFEERLEFELSLMFLLFE
jgi:hypothetical protein